MASASGIKAGRAYVELGVNDRFTKALRAAQAKLIEFGGTIRNIGLGISGVAAAAAAPLVTSVKLFSDVGDAVEKAATRTGMTAEAVSELGFAAEQSGTDMATLEKGLRTMQRTMVAAANGGTAAQEALADIGLTAKDLDGLSPDAQLSLVAERLSQIADPARKASQAIAIFGRAGAQLIPLLAEGASGIATLRQQARDFGISMSGKDAQAAAVLNDALNLLSKSIRGIWLQLGAALAPAASSLAGAMARIAASISKWVAANRPLIVTIAKVIAIVGAVGVALVGIGLTISAAGLAIGGLATAFRLLFSPVSLILAALGGAIAAVLYFSGAGGAAIDWLRDRFGELRDRVTAVLGAIGDAMKAGDLALAAKIAWLAIKAEWVRGTGWLRDIWTDVKAWFLQSWSEVVGGVQLFAAEAWSGFETAAAEAFAFIARAWNNITAFMARTWESVTGWFADRIIDIMGLVDSSLDTAAAKAARRGTDEASISAIDRIQAEQAKLIEGRLQGRRSAAASRLAASRDAIGAGLLDEQRAINSARDAALAETAGKLAAAQDELRGAMEEARRARDAATEGATPERRASLAEAIGGVDVDRGKVEARGIFLAAAIQSLQGGSRHELDRIAKATEDTAKSVRRLEQMATPGGLAFQE